MPGMPVRTIMVVLVIAGVLLTWGAAYAPPPAAINAAILDGLQYLVDTQNANGSWGPNDINAPGAPAVSDTGDVGVTALCAWAFLSHGVSEGDPLPFGPALDAGILYLLNHVQSDGSITNGSYADYHTAASVIALNATGNPAYGPIIVDARNFLKSAQIVEANFPTIPPPILQAMPTYGGWGYNRQSPHGWPIDPVPGPDVMLSDNQKDVGNLPFEGGFWMSRDFWIDNNEDGEPDTLIAGAPNKVWARAFNRGNVLATNVTVDLYYSPLDLGLRLPLPTSNKIGTVNLGDIEPLSTGIGYVEWAAPAGSVDYCIGGIVSADGDAPSLGEPVWNDNNQALQNVVSVGVPNGHTLSIPFTISNPTGKTVKVQLEQKAEMYMFDDEPAEVDLSNWDIEITGGSLTGVNLPSGAGQTRTLQITPTAAVEGEKILVTVVEWVENQGQPGEALGGLTVIAKVAPSLYKAPWSPRPFLWADLSNSQWAIMALSFTETNFLSTLWDDKAILFVNRCQEPPPGTGTGRGFIYTPQDDDAEKMFMTTPYGSMSYAGIWSNALLPLVRTPANYVAALNWARHNYSVTKNPGWWQTVYYYYAVTMAKALQLSHMPWIVEPGPVIHNWYQEIAAELLTRQNPVDGSWVNSIDNSLGEQNEHLCTAYSLLVLKSKASLPPCLKLLIKLIADGVDLRVRDFRGRVLSKLVQEIPDATFFSNVVGQQSAEMDSLDPETYRIVLKNSGAGSKHFKLWIRAICEEDTLFAEMFEDDIDPGQTLGANVNLSNIKGEATVFAEAPTPIPTIAATPDTLRLDLITQKRTATSFSLSATDAAYLVMLSGHSEDLLAELGDEDAVLEAFRFDTNGFDLEPGTPQQVGLEVMLPAGVPAGTYNAEVLVSSHNAETISIPVELNVMLGIRLPRMYAAPGQTIHVPVKIDNTTGLGIVSAQARIAYDGDLLEAIGVSTVGTLADGWTIADTIAAGAAGEPDRVKFAMATAEDTLKGAGALVTIEFMVSGDAELGDACDLAFLSFLLNEGDPSAKARDGSFSVGRAGDVSGNGEVTAYDAAGILQYSVGWGVLDRFPYVDRLAIADVTLNGYITAYDAARVLQFVVGAVPKLPYPDGLTRPVPQAPRLLAFGEAHDRSAARAVVPLIIDEISGVVSGEIDLGYDPEKVRPVDVTRGDLLSDFLFESGTSKGRVRICFAAAQSSVGRGEVAQLTMELLPDVDEEAGLSSLAVLDARLNDGAIPVALGTETVSVMPQRFALHQCFPNPFNPETLIRYDVPLASKVTLKVYNLAGQVVRILADGRQTPGRHTIAWDGLDSGGHEVASGVYFYQMTVPGGFKQTQRMMLIR